MVKYLVLLETSGNQAYLFATNRLRENIGASELTWRSGTQWVLEAVGNAGGPRLWSDQPHRLRQNISRGDAAGGFEVVIATSGKALVVVDDSVKAKKLIGMVTRRALLDAPGLDIAGAIVEYDPDLDPIHGKIQEVHHRVNRVRGLRPGSDLRFQQLPVVAQCASSGLPAAEIEKDPDGIERPFSRQALDKHSAAPKWRKRLVAILQHHGKEKNAELWFPANPADAEKRFRDMDWVGVVHADGNGLGGTFLSFDEHCGCKGNPARNQDYLVALRQFSLELDAATEKAFIDACAILPTVEGKAKGRKRDFCPIIPLVLGGDDLTAMVDGRHSLAFAREFLKAFEAGTRGRDSLRVIANSALGQTNFGACAGIAIVKPHFPFHTAYKLSESLLKSAKDVKKPEHLGAHGSALDFHVLFDASFTSLAAIRERLEPQDTVLTAGPYVVSELPEAASDWASKHDICGLRKRVEAITAQDPETQRSRLPNSQVHALRESLFQGRDIAQARFGELMSRYERQGMGKLSEETGACTLYRLREDRKWETRFLDALTSAPFWLEQGANSLGEDRTHD